MGMDAATAASAPLPAAASPVHLPRVRPALPTRPLRLFPSCGSPVHAPPCRFPVTRRTRTRTAASYDNPRVARDRNYVLRRTKRQVRHPHSVTGPRAGCSCERKAARFHGFCPPMPGFLASALWRLAMVHAARARVQEKAARFNGCTSWMMSFCSSCECFSCIDGVRAFGGPRFSFVRQGRAVSDDRRASSNEGRAVSSRRFPFVRQGRAVSDERHASSNEGRAVSGQARVRSFDKCYSDDGGTNPVSQVAAA